MLAARFWRCWCCWRCPENGDGEMSPMRRTSDRLALAAAAAAGLHLVAGESSLAVITKRPR